MDDNSPLIIDLSDDEHEVPTTPKTRPITSITPTQAYSPIIPPPRFHMGTPDRAQSAPPSRTRSALKRQDSTSRPPRKVRIHDSGDGFVDISDRVPLCADPDNEGSDTALRSKN